MRVLRSNVTGAFLLLVAHGMVLMRLGTTRSGSILSDAMQFALGALLVISCLEAGRRSEGFSRHFWQLTAVSYSLWLIAQGLATISDIYSTGLFTEWVSNLLYCFWFVPLTMSLFLDPEHEHKRFNLLLVTDFVQGILFCISAYLYFYYLPQSESPTNLAHSVWAPYFVGYGLVAGAFVLRSRLTRSPVARQLFGRMGLVLVFSGAVDAFNYYGPFHDSQPGTWVDLLWSVLLLIPLILASSWNDPHLLEPPAAAPDAAQVGVMGQLFPLLFPFLVLVMSVRIAQAHVGWAAAVIVTCFLCSSARQLVTHHRMTQAQEALRREATHDGLTGIWNRMAILEILERELLRSVRTGEPVGVIMADIDHFKSVNDTHGHAAGDAVLRILSSEIASVLRPYDAVGRHGGEEFLIVVPGCGMGETWELAERVRQAVADCQIAAGAIRLKLTLSLGIASGDFARKSESLLQAADTALYRAKNSGRNRVEPIVGSPMPAPAPNPAPNSEAIFWL